MPSIQIVSTTRRVLADKNELKKGEVVATISSDLSLALLTRGLSGGEFVPKEEFDARAKQEEVEKEANEAADKVRQSKSAKPNEPKPAQNPPGQKSG